MSAVCPFARLIPQFSITDPLSGGSGSNSSGGGTGGALRADISGSGMSTPSFEPNAPPDHVPASEVTVPHLISAVPHHSPGLSVDDLDLPDELDLALPISELLKVGTQRAHADAEHSEGAKELLRGVLDLQEYIRWNVILWRVYDALELALSEHYDHPVLAPTYDPRTLGRAGVLAQDISHLLTLLPSSSTSRSAVPPQKLADLATPLPPFPLPAFLLPIFTAPPRPLETYLLHIRSLASSASTAPGLLAHAYVRYLGDMSGGQFIAARIKRSYNLKGADGLRFFHFDQQGRTAEELEHEGGGEARKRLGVLKDWYRRGMNEGVGDDRALKAHLVKEANLAFALNTHLFSLIEPSSSTTSSSPTKSTTDIPSSKVAPYIEQKHLATKQPNTWRGLAEKLVLAVVAIVIAQLLRRGAAPYLAEKWGIIGLAK